LLSVQIPAAAQDGSNMHYLKPNDLNSSHIGKFVHLDFGRRSFGPFHSKERPLDTIDIEIDGKRRTFREHRIDDGFNNWFNDQYLESTEKIDGRNLRLIKSELLEIKDKWIRVRSYFAFVDADKKTSPAATFTKDLEFEKSKLVEVLIEVK
jgi:hypothetical protein